MCFVEALRNAAAALQDNADAAMLEITTQRHT